MRRECFPLVLANARLLAAHTHKKKNASCLLSCGCVMSVLARADHER
jgi:hypothetical protein